MGYSSLSYLKRLPVSCLKIDKTFIGEMMTDRGSSGIVTAIIAMAHTLGINVVAEGVEHDQQLKKLRTLGCDEFQGFLHSCPMTATEFAAMLGQHAGATTGDRPAPNQRRPLVRAALP